MVLAPKQLQPWYTDGRHWEELIDFIDINGVPKEPYIMTSMFKCTLEQANLEGEYMELYPKGANDNGSYIWPDLYNCCLPNAVMLKLGQNPKIYLVKLTRATEQQIAKYVIRPSMVIPASCVKARCVQLLIITHRVWKVLKMVNERRERSMVGRRIILVLM